MVTLLSGAVTVGETGDCPFWRLQLAPKDLNNAARIRRRTEHPPPPPRLQHPHTSSLSRLNRQENFHHAEMEA